MARRLDDRQGLAHGAHAARTGRATRRRWPRSSTCSPRGATWPASSAISRSSPKPASGGSPALIAIGDLGAARVELAALFEIAGRMRQPFALHVAEQYAAAIALCDGRLHEAEAAAERSREWSRLLAGRDPSSVYGIQMFGIRREQGRLAELRAGGPLAGGARQGGGVAARPGGAHGGAGDGARGPCRARPDPGRGARHAAPVALARVAHLPRRRVRDRRRRRDGRARLRGAPPASRDRA